MLCGKPLLQYTIDSALAAHTLSRLVVSTEDAEIAEVALQCGAEVPFMRPPDLALDTTPTLPVVQHALQVLETGGDSFEAVCLLQPTNPLRRAEHIEACLALFQQSQADTVITVLPVPTEYNPHWVYFQTSDGSLRLSTGELEPLPRRQVLPPAFHREGSVYITRRDVIMNRHSLYGERVLGYVIDPNQSINIDTFEDWERAELLLSQQLRVL
jgi:CMP-N-acetylneuraminic acid synthetase